MKFLCHVVTKNNWINVENSVSRIISLQPTKISEIIQTIIKSWEQYGAIKKTH